MDIDRFKNIYNQEQMYSNYARDFFDKSLDYYRDYLYNFVKLKMINEQSFNDLIANGLRSDPNREYFCFQQNVIGLTIYNNRMIYNKREKGILWNNEDAVSLLTTPLMMEILSKYITYDFGFTTYEKNLNNKYFYLRNESLSEIVRDTVLPVITTKIYQYGFSIKDLTNDSDRVYLRVKNPCL